MKRKMESAESEVDRASKRFKPEVSLAESVVPLDLLQIIIKYACQHDGRTVVALLRAGQLFEEILDGAAWKSLYAFRWPKSININGTIDATPSDYASDQFYHQKDAWKNRYKFRARLESEGKKQTIFNPKKIAWARLKVDLIAVYQTPIDHDQYYGDLEKIDAYYYVSKSIPEKDRIIPSPGQQYALQERGNPFQAVIIGDTGVPVKIRVETSFSGGDNVPKFDCNLRVLAFNEKTQLWNVIAAHYANYYVEEDNIHYYCPYLPAVTDTLLKEQHKRLFIPGELYRLVVVAAGLKERYEDANTSSHIDLDKLNK